MITTEPTNTTKPHTEMRTLHYSGTPFTPAWWLKNPHLQTAWPVYFRKPVALQTRDERFELIDGDFIDASWVGPETGPIIVILHG